MKEEGHVDSVGSRHMRGNIKLFSDIKRKYYSNVFIEDNCKGRIYGTGTFGINPKIRDASLVDGLKYNLISVSQLCYKEMRFTFEKPIVM